MFFKSTRGWYAGTEQQSEGSYLLVFQKNKELRAIARRVRLRQCGHFMMGHVSIGGEYITLSGPYGSDGNPLDGEAFPVCWNAAIPLPLELAQEFYKGEGWNDVGDEAPSMRKWALRNHKELSKSVPIPFEEFRWADGKTKVFKQWVLCKNVDKYGVFVKAGDLIRYKEGTSDSEAIGRVLGKMATSDGLLVLRLSDDFSFAYLRTTAPASVTMVMKMPADMLTWFVQPELPPLENIEKLSHQGALSDRYIKKYSQQGADNG